MKFRSALLILFMLPCVSLAADTSNGAFAGVKAMLSNVFGMHSPTCENVAEAADLCCQHPLENKAKCIDINQSEFLSRLEAVKDGQDRYSKLSRLQTTYQLNASLAKSCRDLSRYCAAQCQWSGKTDRCKADLRYADKLQKQSDNGYAEFLKLTGQKGAQPAPDGPSSTPGSAN